MYKVSIIKDGVVSKQYMREPKKGESVKGLAEKLYTHNGFTIYNIERARGDEMKSYVHRACDIGEDF